MPRTALEDLRTRFWKYQLDTERYKRRVHCELLDLDKQLAEARQNIDSLTDATQRLAAVIKHRLGEKVPPPRKTDKQWDDELHLDAIRCEKEEKQEVYQFKIWDLEAKLQNEQNDLKKEAEEVEAFGDRIDVDDPIVHLTNIVLRGDNKRSPREGYRDRRPKRKRYTPKRCIKKEEN